MGVPHAIVFLGLIVLLAHVFTHFFDKIRIPNVLLMMCIGMAVGPVTGLVHESDFGKVGPVFSNLVLLLILFDSGANLRLRDLGRSLLGSSLLTLLMFVGTLVFVGLLAHFAFGLDPVSAAMTGAVLGGTSSAIVIPMIKPLHAGEKARSVLMTESALSDVLCLVSGLALFAALQTGELSVGRILSDVGLNVVLSMAAGVVAALLWSLLLARVRKLQNAILTTGAWLFIVYGTCEALGLNGGICALTLGIVLGNMGTLFPAGRTFFRVHPEPVNETEKAFFGEIVFVAAVYYFVFIGVCMQFGRPGMYGLAAAAMALVFAWRAGVVKVILRAPDVRPDRRTIVAVLPKGLVPAVLASLPLQAGLPGGAVIRDFVFAVILVSIVLSSVAVFVVQRGERKAVAPAGSGDLPASG